MLLKVPKFSPILSSNFAAKQGSNKVQFDTSALPSADKTRLFKPILRSNKSIKKAVTLRFNCN